MVTIIKTATISSKRQITIPKEFSEFKEGQKALLVSSGNKVIIKPLPEETSDPLILAEKSLSECWNSKEDEEAFMYLQDE